jgi:hypothetical protein
MASYLVTDPETEIDLHHAGSNLAPSGLTSS